MPRSSRWTADERKRLLKLVRDGISEQKIRDMFSTKDGNGNSRNMTATEFAQQLKQAMVEVGELKQSSRQTKEKTPSVYQVTNTGRLTIPDFQQITGAAANSSFVLEHPRGRSNAWRIVPVKPT